MNENAPELITINNDDYHAEFVGRTPDNKQFFLTTPFIPKLGNNAGREFVALYLFDFDGKFLEAKIDDLGTHEEMDDDYRATLFKNRLEELGEVSYEPIIIAPFRVEKFNTEFGLILHEPEEEGEDWWAIFEPGNVMAFCPPWDDGEYYT